MKSCFVLVPVAAGLFLTGCSTPAPVPEASKAKVEAPAVQPATAAHDPEVHGTDAVVGVVDEVEPNRTHVVVRTAEAKKHRVELPPSVEVRDLEQSAKDVATGAGATGKASLNVLKKGTHVVVRFSEKEGKKVAAAVHYAAGKTAETTEAIVHRIEDDGRKVVVKTKDGSEEVFEVSKHAAVVSGSKIADIGKTTASKVTQGTKVTLHFIASAGRKVAHHIEH